MNRIRRLPDGKFPPAATLLAGRAVGVALLVCTAGLAIAAPEGLREAALAARSGPRGATMFREMSAAETGLVTENDFADPKMWGERYPEFSQGTVGTGVAIGDYDGDGRPDVFVVSKTGPCRLFRNLGNWKFEDVTEKAGLAGEAGWMDSAKSWIGLGDKAAEDSPEWWKQGAVFADVNNDGWLDLYVCRRGAPNWLYVNQGDGTFKEEAAARGLAVVDACGVGAFCDYDLDGWLDVYVATSMLDAATHPNGSRGYLFHNKGDGTFTNVTDAAGIFGDTLSHSATWWDYDGDGWPDLYVADDFAGPDRLYRNQGDGTFREAIDWAVPHMPYSSMGADLGDVDNDGHIDLFVADMAATTHEKDQRGMAYSRSADNTVDPKARGARQYSHNALYLATGRHRCREAAYLAGLAATDWTWAPRFEDLDNDGRLDLFVTNGMSREFQNVDLLDRALRAESSAERINVMRASPKLVERNLVYRGLGDLRFEEVGAAWGLNQRGVSFGAAFGDLDGDGDLDVVFSNYEGGVTVLRNDSDSGHRLIVALRGTHSNRFGVGATVRIETASGRQVQQLVVARGYLSSSEPAFHFGLGEDTRIAELAIEWPGGAIQVFHDLAADRKYTITEPAQATAPRAKPQRRPYDPTKAQFHQIREVQELAMLPSEEDRFEGPTSGGAGLEGRGPAMAVADVDGDRHDELIIGATGAEPLRIVRAGRIERLATGDGDDGQIAIFDVNGDGAPDLLVTKANAASPRLFLNNGHGGFHAAPGGALPLAAMNAGAIAAADFDRDGQGDVFIGANAQAGQYPLAGNSVLLRNRGVRNEAAARLAGDGPNPWFEDVTAAMAPGLQQVGLVTAALWCDVDGDGEPDLIVACEWGPVRCFHNDRGRRFEDWTAKLGLDAAGTGWWTALALADFNGDGRPDFVAGNVGLNTQYTANAAHPALLFRGDFSDRGGTQLIEAYYEEGKLYPWRTRKELGALVPSVLRRYPRNNNYARATLPEIVEADKLAAAQKFAATELRSGVFLSQPDGTYGFEPLPRITQISPLVHIVAGDFDGDGWADIYAVQNSPPLNGGRERCDGGLSQLLRGDGHGHFVAVPPAQSGLIVPEVANGLAVIDFDEDGWPDFVVARGNGKIRAFQNRGVAGRTPPLLAQYRGGHP